MVQRSMAPVWEANHVWLIFVLVILWTAFGEAFGSIFSTLFVPLLLAADRDHLPRRRLRAARARRRRSTRRAFLGALFALASLLVPFFLGSALGAIAAGEVPAGNAAGDEFSSWLSPTGITVGVLAVFTSAYLAAVYMAADSERAGLPDLVRAFRARALIAGIARRSARDRRALRPARGRRGALRRPHLRSRARIRDRLGDRGRGRPSRSSGRAASASPAGRRPAAVAAITIGWFVAQSPYVLPTDLTIDQAAAPDATLTATLIAVVVGAVLLVPSLYLLYSLVLRGRLDQNFEPLDQRFHPITPADPAAKEAKGRGARAHAC